MLTFGLLFMVVSATRLALLALAFGFTSVRLVPESRFARRYVAQRLPGVHPDPRSVAGAPVVP